MYYIALLRNSNLKCPVIPNWIQKKGKEMKKHIVRSTFILLVLTLIIYGCGKKGPHQEHGTDDHSHDHNMEEVTGQVEFSGQIVDGVREIKIEAFQFGFKPEQIVVKKGEKIRLIAVSTDVTHGIGIKEYNINQTLPPNEEKVIEFDAAQVGEFHFHCSVYCGSKHGKMHGALIVKE